VADWQLDGAWTDSGWIAPAHLRTDEAGRIISLTRGRPERPDEVVAGYALPGFRNAHSHAFQYAMAGLAEHLSRENDDFWSWRQAMYALALTIDPDQLEIIATMLYAEMVRHGYTAVAEFHYLHHDPAGNPYANPAEMGARLVAAAERAGIGITLVPVFYQTGDFTAPAGDDQRRFLFGSLDHWARHLEATAKVVVGAPHARMGGGLHSLRAARPEDVARVFEAVPAGAPRHIHIAEQQREVETCLAVHGLRPVEWLLEHVDVDARYNLVHATHMTPEETGDLAATGATVVLCPTTEGNLGDGFFPLRAFVAAEGSWAIGSDSHIGLSPLEELRWLDYGRRLSDEARNVLCREVGQDSGEAAFAAALSGGGLALGEPATPGFRPGTSFDAVILDSEWPLLAGRPTNRLLSTMIYAGDPSVLRGTIVNGQWVVREGRHREAESIGASYRATLSAMG